MPLLFAPLLVTLPYACSSESSGTGSDGGVGSDASTETAPALPTTVTLSFEARVGSEPFRCGSTYTNVGTSHASATAGDLRFFVHSVRLSSAGTPPVDVVLADRDPWQGSQVGLLDFEDKTGECEFGTSATNATLEGTATVGAYDTLEFTVGVPDALNHVNVETAGAPFAASKLQWDWANGFIHFASQLNSTTTTAGDAGPAVRVPSFFSHVGSTECGEGDPAAGGTSTCARKNRPVVKLSGFNAQRDKIVVDLAKLLATSSLDVNTPETISGCMSGPNDPECAPVFAQLGLDFATGAPSATHAQEVFSVAAK